MQYFGDVKLFSQPDGAQIVFDSGQPVMTGGLENAIFLSLSAGEWWGNAFAQVDDRFSSQILELVTRRALTDQSRLDVAAEASRLLAWLRSQNVAGSYRVSATAETLRRLSLLVEIEEPGSDAKEFLYRISWDAQRASLAEVE